MKREHCSRLSREVRAVAILFLIGACGHYPLTAQTNLETNAGVHFNFSTPGAGNLALGGAFLALAFDASAAYTNPAGLTTIAAPEVLVEARHWSFTHVFTDRGRIEGRPPTGEGLDTIAGLRDGQAEDQLTGLSFLSYVHPYRDDWSFAVYRHELVNFEASFSINGAYLERTRGRSLLGIPGTFDGRLAALRNRMELEVVAYGGSAAYRLGNGLSLGVTGSYFEFCIDSTTHRYLPEIFSPPDFSPNTLVNSQRQQGEDSDWGFGGGFLWESPKKRWSVGGVYRQGPDFTLHARSQPEKPAVVKFEPQDQQAVFRVPDTYGIGVAFRPSDALRLALDYDHVRYYQITKGFVDIFGLAQLSPSQPRELDHFVIDDVNEVHLGAEYAFLRSWPVLTVRAGAWYEPDHSLRFEGENVGFRAVFRPRGDQMHYTAGAGLALRRIQLDAAVDYSDRITVLALSTGLRF